MKSSFEEIDNLFLSYNYSIGSKSNEDVRIYTLAYGMYHAAEILLINQNFDPAQLKKSYSELGYATEIRTLTSIELLEEYLFEGFFIKTPLGSEIKNKYRTFTKKQIQNLPTGSSYSYINTSYEIVSYNSKLEQVENKNYDGIIDQPLVSKIGEIISNNEEALFMVIEAPAGFGKTCTAYELLNLFESNNSKNLPFFTELSRNREARIFKHILLSEIDEQFPSGIKQKIVLDQIYKGRIPLIIDGFDELITKESNKEDVESMLTTIVDLLRNKAKVIITARKTAIFNSEEFLKSLYETSNNFNLIRIEIKEPKIANWLEKDRIELIEKNKFPLNQIGNPVLLAYIKNLPIELLSHYINDREGTLIEKYFSFLLEREITRQNLKLTTDEQWEVMGNINSFFCEVNITAESKDTIKEIIKDYNYNLLLESLSRYPSEVKPTIDELSEILSNHVLLDRKSNDEIGFINDFILGYFTGDNVLNRAFNSQNNKLDNFIPTDYAYKSVEAFMVASELNQSLLWDSYTKFSKNYENSFYFELDLTLKKQILKDFRELYVFDKNIENITFKAPATFLKSAFSGVSFINCHFDISIFKECSFQNCSFFDCQIIDLNKNILFKDFAIYVCTSNNNFLEQIDSLLENEIQSNDENLYENSEEDILKKFFQVGEIRPRPRKLSSVRKMFEKLSDREFSRIIDSLKSKEFLHFKDDVAFITREAINHLKHTKGNEQD
ncbi:NACHT domain-containing protein [Sphingobacterium mizutaii]|uniref:NACHT domain-containing protein n=1 Tax=Sphingobacterium mizutaii TaxID=1010 RepID=UPI0016243E3A|nr:NACHT domain-containing protein [Sphingobacterium mizutaii]